jgi:hypothetical protein
LKYHHGPLSPRSAQFGASLGPTQRVKPAAPSVSTGRCQVGLDASRTPPVSLTSSRTENRYAPNSLLHLLPFQTNPLPLLARVATPVELPPMSRPPVTTSRLKGVRVCACPPPLAIASAVVRCDVPSPLPLLYCRSSLL